MNIKLMEQQKRINNKLIHDLESELALVKAKVKKLYDDSDANTKRGQDSYSLLNSTQNYKRKLKAKLKTLRELQKAIKRSISVELRITKYMKDSEEIEELFKTTNETKEANED